MRKILEDFYYGRLVMYEQTFKPGSEYAKVLSAVTQLEDKLRSALPEDRQELLRDYSAVCTDLASISKLEDFISGFRIGAQIMMAILMTDEQESK